MAFNINTLFEASTPDNLRSAVSAAYRFIFEGTDNDSAGGRDPAMSAHGTVNNVGPGNHTVTMGPDKVGYDIDGTHIGWANPGGKYSSAIDAQNTFVNAYLKKLNSAAPKLSAEDRKACALVMGDYDGMWYYNYDNGSGNLGHRNVSDEMREFGGKVGMVDDKALAELTETVEELALKYAKKNGELVPPAEVSEWFKKHGVKLDKGQLKEIMELIQKKVKFYIDEDTRLSKLQEDTGIDNIKELTVTDTGLDNIPKDEGILKNLAYMSKHLKALRDATGLNIHVNSCYRSPQVNKAVGGVSTSAHMKGLAMDLTAGNEEANRKMYKALVDRVRPWDIDQVIMYNETPHDKKSRIRFIHVGMNPAGGRHQLLFS